MFQYLAAENLQVFLPVDDLALGMCNIVGSLRDLPCKLLLLVRLPFISMLITSKLSVCVCVFFLLFILK